MALSVPSQLPIRTSSVRTPAPTAKRFRLPRLDDGTESKPPLTAMLGKLAQSITGIKPDPEKVPAPIVHRRPASFFD